MNGTGSCDCHSGYSGTTCSNREYSASVAFRIKKQESRAIAGRTARCLNKQKQSDKFKQFAEF